MPDGTRRKLLLAGAAMLVPVAGRSAGVCTPRDLAKHFADAVRDQLALPAHEVAIYSGLAEMELSAPRRGLERPQYLLVVDSCPWVQAAFLFWRLLPGRYELVGATPASTGNPARAECVATPCGVFPQADAGRAVRAPAGRVYDFGLQRVRRPGTALAAPLHLQAHAATGASRWLLGTAQSDGRVLLPASLVEFLDAYGVLDAAHGDASTPAGEALPFPGQLLVVVDSEREERPEWAGGPAAS